MGIGSIGCAHFSFSLVGRIHTSPFQHNEADVSARSEAVIAALQSIIKFRRKTLLCDSKSRQIKSFRRRKYVYMGERVEYIYIHVFFYSIYSSGNKNC